MEQYKTCSKCKQSQLLENFRKHSGRKDGHDSFCKKCKSIADKAYYEANKETVKLRVRDWWKTYSANNKDQILDRGARYRAKNLEKVRLASKKSHERNPALAIKSQANRRAAIRKATTHKITSNDIKRLLEAPCIYCGSKATHIDHIIPLARGGNQSIGNLAPACAKCNLSKGSKLVTEWRYRLYSSKSSSS